jgi:hypothetical protein
MQIQTSGQYLRNLKMLHTTLLVFMILFCIIVVVLMSTGSFIQDNGQQLHRVMQFVAPLTTLAAIAGSAIIFKKRTDALKDSGLSLRFRLEKYRTACIMRWALLEGAVTVSLLAQLLTQQYYYSIFIFLLLVFFFLYAPSAEKIKMQLQLDGMEQARLDDVYQELD